MLCLWFNYTLNLPSVGTHGSVFNFSLGRLTHTVKESVLAQGRDSVLIYCHNLYLADSKGHITAEKGVLVVMFHFNL